VKINAFISILFLLFSFFNLNAQTYNYSYTDPCTGNIKTIVVPINGSVTVGYYGFVNNFTQQDFVDGTFETWANDVFSQFDGSPCSEIVGLSGTINIAQDVALNTIGVITSLSALMDISNGATDFLSGTLTAASNSSNSKSNKNNKNNKGNSSQNGSGSNQTNNNKTSNNGNPTTNNNQNQTNGTSNTNEGSTTTTGTNETSSNGGNGTTNPNAGTQNTTQAGGTTTQGGTNENGNSQTSQSINNQNNNTNENNSTTNGVGNIGGNSGNGNSTNGEGNTQQGQEVNQNTTSQNNQTTQQGQEVNQNTTSQNNQTTQEGQTTNNQTTTNTSSPNGGNGSNGSQPNTEETTTPEESGGQTNITQGATKTINQNKEGGKPTVIASSDFVGFNFQNSEVTTGLKLTGGYHNMRWDGETARGGLVDYVSAQKGPNITGYHAWINKKSMGLLSGTLSIGFEGRGSLYGTLAGGQMFMFPKVPGLKAVYMGTISYGQVYKTSFLGSAVIGGGMYDLKLGRRFDVKLMGLFVYSPYVSYYNDLVLKSPYVILPTVGTNIAITKRFKFNINGGGAWAIKVNTLNYTITCGTRLLIGQ
jgi:hypothetical protein